LATELDIAWYWFFGGQVAKRGRYVNFATVLVTGMVGFNQKISVRLECSDPPMNAGKEEPIANLAMTVTLTHQLLRTKARAWGAQMQGDGEFRVTPI